MKTSKHSPEELTRKTRRAIRHEEVRVDRLMKQRKRLLRLRENLLTEIQQLKAEACEENPCYSMHPADAGTDSFDRDLILGIASFDYHGLYEIDAALKRMEDGTYGVCELTGQKIPWERLEAIPWARFSLEADKRINGNFHPHLGPLVTLRPFAEQPVENASEDVAEENGIETFPAPN